MRMRNKKEIYIIKGNKIYSAIGTKKEKNKNAYCYVTIMYSGEKILINKSNIFNSLKKAEKFLYRKKITSQRYIHRKIKRKRIEDRILDLEDSMFWSIKAQSRNKIAYEEAEEIIKKCTEEIRKLKKRLN